MLAWYDVSKMSSGSENRESYIRQYKDDVLQPDHNIDHDNVGDILILDINYDSKAQTVGQGTRSKMVTSGWTASGDWPSKEGQWLDFYNDGG